MGIRIDDIEIKINAVKITEDGKNNIIYYTKRKPNINNKTDIEDEIYLLGFK